MQQEMPFCVWLKQRRSALDLTQWELAERIGCSRDTVQKIEAGSRRPSKQVAELLAACLGIPPEERPEFVAWARLGPEGPSSTVVSLEETPPSSFPSSLPEPESPAPNGLPIPLTSLIGREQEIESARHHLLRHDIRLMTLVGPPGIGKTRLGIATAAAASGSFKDGVFFVNLEAINDPHLVATSIARSLGVKQTGSESISSALKQHLRDKRILLVLDNFEQVLDAGPEVLELLSACPGLKMLVTSREALHAYGEWRFPVPPLKLPDCDRTPNLDPDAVGRVAAIALFTQRAQAVKSDFSLTSDNIATVAAICTRLDGLPLAIELAATRVGLHSPDAILSGLGNRLRLLKGNLRYLPPRQQTLRGAIDWSHDLLGESERVLFRRMGVFVGGATLAAAEAVCNVPGSVAGSELLEGLASLVDKSLLQYQMGEGDEPSRYSTLEVLREYALEQLRTSGEEEAIHRAHAEFYCQVVQAAAPELDGPNQAKWLQELEAENANIRAALAWSIEGGAESAELGLRLSGWLGRFWDMRGYINEGRRWLGSALENAGAAGKGDATTDRLPTTIPPAVLIKALTAAGGLANVQGDYAAARSYHSQALLLGQKEGDKASVATSFLNLGNAATRLGEHEEARAFHERALSLFRELGNERLVARTLLNMGFNARTRGDYARAHQLYEESLALRRELGDKYGIALALGNLGEIALEQGDYFKARALLEESLSLRQEIGNELGIAFCLIELGKLAHVEGNPTQARALCEEGLMLRRKMGDTEGVASCLEWLAETYADTHPNRSIRVWGAADAIRSSGGAPIPLAFRSRHEESVARTRAVCGEQVFDREWAEGHALTLEKAIEIALED